MDKKAYWLWLREALGAGAVTDEITAVFPSPEEMYSRGEIEWRLSGVLTNRQIEKLKQCSPEKAQGIVDVCCNNGWTVLTPDDEDYPLKLRSLRNMPLALFVRGDIKRVTQRVCIAIVGTRKASFQGSYLAHRYAAALAYSGICVVSGAAMGIDSCAHNGALDSGGVTAAVLGCGFGYKYLMENEYLRDCVAQSGALITEFPPGFPSSARTFPIRNRIISGLCDATIVIEAGVKSGSLITANCAIEQGRDVFAPPGDVFNSSYAGANRLIRDGARPLLSIYDLITEYSVRYPDKIKPENMAKALEYLSGKRELTQEQAKEEPKTVERPHESVKKFEPEPKPEEFRVKKLVSIPVGLSEKAKKIYESMGEEPLFADEIAAKTGFAPWEVVSSMTELELEDLVCLCAGKRYKKI